MKTISVCMIVKNEERVLARALSSVTAFADEIIIVDTGSTDKTKEIAKAFTNKIYYFEWINDFSAARNYSFSLAKGDYLMWLDADDYIDEENIEKIVELKSKLVKDVYMLRYAMGEKKQTAFSFYRERILKRSQNFVWEGIVHEAISPRGTVEYIDITIEHKKLVQNEPMRNLMVYENAIKQGKILNQREKYYYARELFFNSRKKEASFELINYLYGKTYEPDAREALIMLSDIFLSYNNLKAAQKAIQYCFENFTPTAEVCCKCAKLHYLNSAKDKAVFYFTAALAAESPQNAFDKAEYKTLVPLLELTAINYELGKINLSYEYHKKAAKLFPDNPSVCHNERFFNDYFKNS